MYYVWEPDLELVSEYACCTQEPDGFDSAMWSTGKRLSMAPPHLTLTTDDDGGAKLSDLFLVDFDLPIFSPKLVQLFERMGVQNLTYYPVTIINSQSGETETNYKAANIIGRIPCLDADGSTVTYAVDGSGDIMFLEEFSLFEDKIKTDKKLGGKPLVFRLAEFDGIKLADQSVRRECETAGISGFSFIDPSEHVG